MVIIIVMFTHQVGQLQESIDLLNRKLSEAEAAHQVLTLLEMVLILFNLFAPHNWI